MSKPSDDIVYRSCGHRKIAIFGPHHYALVPWAEWVQGIAGVRIITIDHHCDTKPAFEAAARSEGQVNHALRQSYIDQIDRTDLVSIETAIGRLKHDEHIDAALRAGILDAALVISCDKERPIEAEEMVAYERQWRSLGVADGMQFRRENPRPKPPYTYIMPADRIAVIGAEACVHGGNDVSHWTDRVLEADFLEPQLAIFEQLCRSAGEPSLEGGPYILDIDLDAFNSRAALKPADPTTFYRLVQGAIGITIAREPECFEDLWGDGEAPPVAEAEQAILEHIAQACGLPVT